ncbi:MAG TPA: hypothetical protein VIL13_02005, partial [Longimicrobiales bacterium]
MPEGDDLPVGQVALEVDALCAGQVEPEQVATFREGQDGGGGGGRRVGPWRPGELRPRGAHVHAEGELGEASAGLGEVGALGSDAAGDEQAEAAPEGEVELTEQPPSRPVGVAAEAEPAGDPEPGGAEAAAGVEFAVGVVAIVGSRGAREQRQRLAVDRRPAGVDGRALEPGGAQFEGERADAGPERERDRLP